VISKHRLKSDQETHKKLSERIQKWEERAKKHLNKTDEKSLSPVVTAVTHLNVFLYATCYFIQSGTLPV